MSDEDQSFTPDAEADDTAARYRLGRPHSKVVSLDQLRTEIDEMDTEALEHLHRSITNIASVRESINSNIGDALRNFVSVAAQGSRWAQTIRLGTQLHRADNTEALANQRRRTPWGVEVCDQHLAEGVQLLVVQARARDGHGQVMVQRITDLAGDVQGDAQLFLWQPYDHTLQQGSCRWDLVGGIPEHRENVTQHVNRDIGQNVPRQLRALGQRHLGREPRIGAPVTTVASLNTPATRGLRRMVNDSPADFFGSAAPSVADLVRHRAIAANIDRALLVESDPHRRELFRRHLGRAKTNIARTDPYVRWLLAMAHVWQIRAAVHVVRRWCLLAVALVAVGAAAFLTVTGHGIPAE